MNKFSSTLLSLCLLGTSSLTFAMEPMEQHGAMEKDAMKIESMNKDGAMTKAQPKKMKKKTNKMDKMEHGGSMAMDPKK